MAGNTLQEVRPDRRTGSLLAPAGLDHLSLRNRLVVAPMTRVSATADGRPTPRMPGQHEPGLAELRLIAELPRGPLRRRPDGGEHDREDDEDLTPEDARGVHALGATQSSGRAQARSQARRGAG